MEGDGLDFGERDFFYHKKYTQSFVNSALGAGDFGVKF
jgi:hypothetical protein